MLESVKRDTIRILQPRQSAPRRSVEEEATARVAS